MPTCGLINPVSAARNGPECYGNIGTASVETPTVGSTYERLASEAQQPLSWATPVHRLIASILGLTVLAMALVSIRLRTDRVPSFTLLALTVFLAWLGIYYRWITQPPLLSWVTLPAATQCSECWDGWCSVTPGHDRTLRVQYATGCSRRLFCLRCRSPWAGLTSANFAASACQTLPDCHGSYLPGPHLATAFDLTRVHETGPTGVVLGGAERADIHKLHRLGAALSVLVILTAGATALRSGLGVTAITVLVLVIAEFAVGAGAILADLPIAIAVTHNWLAALLMLGLIRLLALSNNRQALL